MVPFVEDTLEEGGGGFTPASAFVWQHVMAKSRKTIKDIRNIGCCCRQGGHGNLLEDGIQLLLLQMPGRKLYYLQWNFGSVTIQESDM